jgi:hypothetical protein
MKAKYIIFNLMIIQSYVLANLTNHDFCMKVNNKENKCHGKFSYECKPDKCSIDRAACQYFNSLTFVSNLPRINNEKDRQKFNEFKRAIKTCEIRKYTLKMSDVCSKIKCMINASHFDVLMGSWGTINKECACPKKHSFKCNHNVCSTDKNSCENFKNIWPTKPLTECRHSSSERKISKSPY